MATPDLPPDFPRAADVVPRVGRLRDWADFDIDYIPPSWDLHLTYTSHRVKKIDHEAQRVLAFLLSWYSPRPRGGARFAGDALDVPYALLMTRFKLAKPENVRTLLNRMEDDHGVIRRHSGGRGVGRGAFLKVTLVMDRVEAITYPVIMDTRTGELVEWRHGHPVSGGPYYIPWVRDYAAGPTGLVFAEDDTAVHLLSIQKRTAAGRGALPVGDPRHSETEVGTVTAGQTSPVGPSDRGDISLANGDDDQIGPTGSPPGNPVSDTASFAADTIKRHQVQTNAPARRPTIDDDDRLRRQLDAFRRRFEYELGRTTGNSARRAVARTAWQAASTLLPGELEGRVVYNAWQRLERAGSADPALDLIGAAAFACGRVTGRVSERTATAHALLDAVSRRQPVDVVDPGTKPDEAAVHRALRTALLHRLDPFSVRRTIVQVCGFKREQATYVFINGLVRLYATHDVPFNAALFAGALAAAVRDHSDPTARDLLDACEAEATLYPCLHVCVGDSVLLGTLDEGELVSDEALKELGRDPGRHYHENGVWAEVEEVDALNRTIWCSDGSALDHHDATVHRTGIDKAYWLAGRVRSDES